MLSPRLLDEMGTEIERLRRQLDNRMTYQPNTPLASAFVQCVGMPQQQKALILQLLTASRGMDVEQLEELVQFAIALQSPKIDTSEIIKNS